MGFRDVFRLMPASEIATVTDVLSRNAVFTSNEIRQMLGKKPSGDPRANELSNKNMPESSPATLKEPEPEEPEEPDQSSKRNRSV